MVSRSTHFTDSLQKRLLSKPNPRLLSEIIGLFGQRLALACVFYLMNVTCTLATPFVIFEFLQWVQEDDPAWAKGTLLTVALGFAAASAFVFLNKFDHVAHVAGIDARAAAMGLLYRKVLRLSSADAASTHSGIIINLFQSDANLLVELLPGLITLLLQPVEIVAIVGLLWYFVGIAALAGVGVVVTALLVAFYGSTHVERLSVERSSHADVRLRDLNELLQGMKVVKLNAWEARFAALIAARRSKESGLTRAMGTHLAYVNTSGSNSVDVISLAIILVFTLPTALNQALTPETTFTFWVLLGMLHGRIFHYPMALKHFQEGRAAARRIQAFLDRPERVDSRIMGTISLRSALPCGDGVVVKANGEMPAVSLQHASFTWAASTDYSSAAAGSTTVEGSGNSGSFNSGAGDVSVLQDISLSVPIGAMCAVVGPVGTGKSSMLAAMLAEMTCTAGSVELRHPASGPGKQDGTVQRPLIAYIPQLPWVVQGSVRSNIVFGQAWDPEWYAEVVRACALEPDFRAWTAGDESPVGAFTLSGGQKARISIARAVYARARLYLIDDCLSALDARVGRHVLEQALVGLLGTVLQSTRVVVTNAPAMLQHCDVVAVMLQYTGPETGNGTAQASLLAAVEAVKAASPLLSPTKGPSSTVPTRLSLMTSNESEEEGAGTECESEETPRSHGPFTCISGRTHELMLNPALSVLLHLQAGQSTGASVDEVLQPTSVETAASRGMPVASGAAVLTQSDESNESLRSPRTPTGAPSLSAVPQEPLQVQERASLPFVLSWMLGSGGSWFAAGVTLFLLLEATWVEAGVYLLAHWSDDRTFQTFSYNTYLLLYGSAVLLELMAAYIRQHIYSAGTVKAVDDLHSALLFRVAHAPQSWFDTHAASYVLDWFGASMVEIENETFYASEYFWLGFVYGLLVVVSNVLITPWVVLPFLVSCVLLWAVIVSTSNSKRKGEGKGQQNEGESKRDISKGVGFLPSSGGSISELLVAEAEARNPLQNHFGESLEGLVSVRAFGVSARMEDTHHAHANVHASALAHAHDAQSASVMLANLVGATYYFLSVLIVVPLRVMQVRGTMGGIISGGDAGFIVVNACFASYLCVMVMQQRARLVSLALTQGRLVRQLSTMPQEASIHDEPQAARTSTEVEEKFGKYASALGIEPRPKKSNGHSAYAAQAAHQEADPKTDSESCQDHVVFDDVRLRYSPDGPLVLKGLSFSLPRGSHCGVVGRTGAGKSTLLAALTRTVELDGGAIRVSGRDIAAQPLAAVRAGVAVISQDPLFFSGTLRRNLDPFAQYLDEELLGALRRVELFQFAQAEARTQSQQQRREGVHSISSGHDTHALHMDRIGPLDITIAERGGNLSVGQQQLLALARALLRRPALLCLDEATASLDVGTEALVNDMVHDMFHNATVLQIAHRLVSVIGSHTVLVLSDGQVVERGHPWVLLQRPALPCGAPVLVLPHTGTVPPVSMRGLFSAMVASLPDAQAAHMRDMARAAYERHKEQGKLPCEEALL